MTDDPTSNRAPFGSWPRAFAIAFAIWTVPAAMDATAFWFVILENGGLGGPLEAVQRAFFKWWLFAAMTPAVWWLADRVRLDGERRLRALGIHAAAAVLFALVHLTGIALWAIWAWGGFDESLTATIGWYYMTGFVMVFLAYWAMVAVAQMGRYHDLWRDRELRAARLESSLSRSRLEALQAQLQPHFLFNTLNGVIGLLRYHREKEAIRMVSGLGALLRRALEAEEPLTSLADELDFVEEYLDIERVRLGDRLRVEFDVDPDALDATTPRLLLQAVVENAVRHGISRRLEGGTITIGARREADRVRIVVDDDGPGPDPGRVAGAGGVGLENTRERLRHTWGSEWRLDLGPAPGGGARVTIEHPYAPNGAGERSAPESGFPAGLDGSRASRAVPPGPARGVASEPGADERRRSAPIWS